MSFYRLYCRDRDGHFSGVIDFEARNEAQALRMADRMCWREKRELWRDTSLLMQWDGQRRLAASVKQQPRNRDFRDR